MRVTLRMEIHWIVFQLGDLQNAYMRFKILLKIYFLGNTFDIYICFETR